MSRITLICLTGFAFAIVCSLAHAQREPSGPIDPDPTFVPNPEHPRDYLKLGNLWLEKQNYPKAIENYTRAYASDNTMLDALFNRGYAYRMLEKYDQALSDYNAVLAADPKCIDAINNRGVIWCLKGNLYEAVSDFDRALVIDPKNGVVARNRKLLVQDQNNFEHLRDKGGVPELEDAYIHFGFERPIAP